MMNQGDMAKNSNRKLTHDVACTVWSGRCSDLDKCQMMQGCGHAPVDDRPACIDNLNRYSKPS